MSRRAMSRRAPRALLLAAALGLGLSPVGAGARSREPGQVVRVEHRAPDTLPTLGPTSAPVTIEYFFLPTPNAHARMPSYKMLERLQASHPTRVRVVFRVVKRNALVQLPTAALEAHAQGKFFELMEELHRSRTTTTPGQPEILEMAKRIGMDVPRVAAAMMDGRYNGVLEANDRRLSRLMRGQPTVPAVLFNTKLPRASLSSMGEGDYEREYNDAYERAMDLIDRGIEPRSLMEAFDALVLRGAPPVVGSTGPTDDDITGELDEHRLASPPLQLAGLPTYGRPDVKAPIPILILCRPNDSQCGSAVRQLRRLQETYADDVRLVWAPWFDVGRDDAAELTLLGDAALCAEQLGSNPEDLHESPGWRWIERQLQRPSRAPGRRAPAEKMIDDLTAELRLDRQQLSACRARMANATLSWIERARRSGVTRAPALVIGGRIYEGIPAHGVIQQLIEAELAPGVLGELAPAWPRARR